MKFLKVAIFLSIYKIIIISLTSYRTDYDMRKFAIKQLIDVVNWCIWVYISFLSI